MNSFKLSDIIETKTRFGRSVNLERDFYADVSLDGYVLTTTAVRSLERLTDALAENAPTRAWTLTGAFGSGKSTFALFAAKVFGRFHRRAADFRQAERLIKQKNSELWQTVFENSETARLFTNLESLVIAQNNQLKNGETDFQLVRLSLTQINADERARVLSIRPPDKEKMAEAEREILKAFAKSNINGNVNLRLAVLANLSLKILEQDK